MAKRSKKLDDFFTCPSCGAKVRVGAKFCRECGASDESGWGEDDSFDDDGTPAGYADDDDFDYDDFVRREFPDRSPARSKGWAKRLAMGVVVAIVIAAFLASMMSGFW
jgi:hypothetical protein